jgi:hypothetical protein
MAKKDAVNKTQAVKEYLKANPKAKNQAVVEALTKKGISISTSYVGNIKAIHNKRHRAARKVVAKGGVGIPEVKVALTLLKVTGSVAAATRALAVAQEIREIA